MAEGPAGGQAGHRRALPFPDRRGQLQLALRLPLRLPHGGGEDCHLQERVHVLLGRDGVQDPSSPHTAGLGRRPLLRRRLPRWGRADVGFQEEPVPALTSCEHVCKQAPSSWTWIGSLAEPRRPSSVPWTWSATSRSFPPSPSSSRRGWRAGGRSCPAMKTMRWSWQWVEVAAAAITSKPNLSLIPNLNLTSERVFDLCRGKLRLSFTYWRQRRQRRVQSGWAEMNPTLWRNQSKIFVAFTWGRVCRWVILQLPKNLKTKTPLSVFLFMRYLPDTKTNFKNIMIDKSLFLL